MSISDEAYAAVPEAFDYRKFPAVLSTALLGYRWYIHLGTFRIEQSVAGYTDAAMVLAAPFVADD